MWIYTNNTSGGFFLAHLMSMLLMDYQDIADAISE